MTRLTATRKPDNQIELSWPTQVGFSYQLQESELLRAWTNIGEPIEGTGNIYKLTIPSFREYKYFRLLIEFPQGSSPPAYLITAWDGSRVELYWEPFGPSPNGQYQIFRNNALLAVVDAESDGYIDTTVASSQHYDYEVKFFST